MDEICKYHEDMMKAQNDKISRSSIKWLAGIFMLPLIAALFAAYAFYATADYRYGSNVQARENAANIKILDERMINIKGDMLRMQGDINNNIIDLRTDVKELTKEIRSNREIR